MRPRPSHLAPLALVLVGSLTVWTIATHVFPYHSLNHDEGVYLQQAGMLLEGQVNLWPPAEGIFRPWFFIEDGDRLYPKYSPIPAAMFAVGHVFGGYRLALAGIAGANLALVFAIGREVFDRQTGLLAGIFVLGSPLFLVDSSVFLPYAPTTLLNLLFAYAYLRADRTDDRRWAAVAGTAVGLAFFARPFTAVLFAAPFCMHALWTIYSDRNRALERQLVIATFGLAGVGAALGYNALMTGSPVRFPYQVFAPSDGLGFGQRSILGHEVQYTPELAMRANREVIERFFTEWILGGVFGAILAAVGLARSVRQGRSHRTMVVAGLFVSVILGNVLFWGNYNILGDIDRPGDGLVSVLGPYYHFDLLLPTAVFAAAGALWGGRILSRTLEGRLERRVARTALLLVLVVGVSVVGTTTANDLEERLDENLQATNTYADAYEPFEEGPPKNSVVLLPDPYGGWLNHPFQPLRNDPGFDGQVVYALDDRPFEVIDEFPDRRSYRYSYRGAWAPYAGSPEAARLQRIRHVSGSRVDLETTVGIPDGAIGVTARIETDDGSAYYVAEDVPDTLAIDLTVTDGTVEPTGDLHAMENGSIAVDGRDTVRTTIFVDYGGGGGFSYRIAFPVSVTDEEVRALSPRLEHCRDVRACGGEAAYVPKTAPEGVFVRTTLSADEPND